MIITLEEEIVINGLLNIVNLNMDRQKEELLRESVLNNVKLDELERILGLGLKPILNKIKRFSQGDVVDSYSRQYEGLMLERRRANTRRYQSEIKGYNHVK